jgi:dsRNA-specific ribonuclease
VVSEKTMATTMEALIGGVFCDSGEEALEKLLETLGLDHEYLKPVTLTSHFLYQRGGARHAALANYVSRP